MLVYLIIPVYLFNMILGTVSCIASKKHKKQEQTTPPNTINYQKKG